MRIESVVKVSADSFLPKIFSVVPIHLLYAILNEKLLIKKLKSRAVVGGSGGDGGQPLGHSGDLTSGGTVGNGVEEGNIRSSCVGFTRTFTSGNGVAGVVVPRSGQAPRYSQGGVRGVGGLGNGGQESWPVGSGGGGGAGV
uniref:Uncharacterized protein LOC114912794 n=1 Tax=Elaeis guineensis var. tenera TaxID=51953 RepID=A0A8N4EWJ3_ELAGV|nr:uncharacterized protein LOC114912794 [Elaeis guineensis]